MTTFLFALAALVLTTVIARAALPIGTALGLLDYPDESGGRKQHAAITPLVGGIALAVTTLASIGAMVVLVDAGPLIDRDLLHLALAVGAMFAIGVADDRFELSVRVRLIVASLVLLFIIDAVPDFALTFVRFGHAPALHLLGGYGAPFTLLCLVGLLNAVNMADGKNGLVIGMALIWSAFLLRHLPAPVVPVMAAVAATLAVLFVFNLRGKLFLGDGGSYTVSALFGLVAVYAYNHDFAAVGADDFALLFAVPVFDTLRLLVGRGMARRSPFAGGRDHLHHYLYAWLGWPRGLYVYLTLVGVPNLVAALRPDSAMLGLAVTAVAYAVVLSVARRSGATLAKG